MKIRMIYFFLSVLILLPVLTNFGQKSVENPTAKALNHYLTLMTAFGYSGAVLVEKDGKIIFQKGYGFANRENHAPVNLDTPFVVASISKQFTAAAVLKLEEQGKLNLNETITKFFKDVPDDKKSITIGHLLSHTSGLGDNYAGNNIMNREDAVRAILATPLQNPVGEKYFYSNDGYDLASAIVEIVSHEDLRSFIRKNFFEPAGMKNAGFIGERSFWKKGEVAHSFNYYIDNGSPQFDKADWDGHGSADVIVSINDLYKWELSLRKNEVLSAAIKQKMFTPHSALSNGWHYGYGWFVIKTDRGTTEYYHGGSEVPRGFTASYSRYPDEKTTIIILVNTMIDEIGFLRAVKNGVVNITFGKNVELPPSFANIDISLAGKYAGEYETEAGAKIIVQIKNGDLMIGGIGQESINLLTTPDKKLIDELNSFNESTKAFIDKIVPDPESIPELKLILDSFSRQDGNYKGFEILGTYPVSTEYKVSTSFVKLHYEKGDEMIRIVHRENNSYSIKGNALPALTPLKLQKNNDFVAYYPLLQKTVRVRFEKNKNGKITGLILENINQSVAAKKISSETGSL